MSVGNSNVLSSFSVLYLLHQTGLVHSGIAWIHSVRTQPAFDGWDNHLCHVTIPSLAPLHSNSHPLYRDYPSKYIFCFPASSSLPLNPSPPSMSKFPHWKSTSLQKVRGLLSAKIEDPSAEFQSTFSYWNILPSVCLYEPEWLLRSS